MINPDVASYNMGAFHGEIGCALTQPGLHWSLPRDLHVDRDVRANGGALCADVPLSVILKAVAGISDEHCPRLGQALQSDSVIMTDLQGCVA